jgi:Peptidase MA superfamily
MTRGPRHLLALLAALAALFVVLFGSGHAMADGPVAAAPHDAPFILEPRTVTIPALPPGFVVRDHGWLKIAYPAGVEARVAPLLDAADAAKADFEAELGQKVLGEVAVRVARDPDEMAEIAPAGLPPPAYAVGVAYAPLKLVLLSLRDPGSSEAPDLLEVFRHELVHVALEDAVEGRDLPRWFNEGLAIQLSGETRFKRLRTLWDASYSRNLVPLSELDKGFPDDRYQVNVAYAEAADVVRFLLRDPDKARFRALIERVRGGEAFDRSVADAYGIDLRSLEYEWREDVDKRYSFWPAAAGGSLLWVGVIGLMVAGYVRRRRQARAKLAQWAREDAVLDAELAAARASRDTADAPDPAFPVRRPSDLPRVHHEGSWHTLH